MKRLPWHAGKFSANITCFMVGLFVGAFICNFISKFVKNKRTVPMICWTIAGITAIVCAFVKDIALLNVLTFVTGAFEFAGLTAVYGMVPDVTEYAQSRTGMRAGGVLFSVINFGTKLGMALSASVFGWILGGLGYLPGGAPSSAVLNVMNWSFTGANGILFFIGVIAMAFYNLDKKSHAELVKQLEGNK